MKVFNGTSQAIVMLMSLPSRMLQSSPPIRTPPKGEEGNLGISGSFFGRIVDARSQGDIKAPTIRPRKYLEV